MTVRIFYSWQSDRPKNRNFIRAVLDAAIKDLRQDATLEEAQREIEIDQDTQGLPGSPPIADAILTKIRSAEIFIADLTFVDDHKIISDEKVRRIPNPNVMLEYGYALHALGDARIIGLFNDVYGPPESLPFDLAHRRWPIRFSLTHATVDERKSEKLRLTAIVKEALRSIISQIGEPPSLGISTTFSAAEPGDGIGRMRNANDYLCMDSAEEGKPVWLQQGPYAFLRLVPTIKAPVLGEVEAYKIAQAHLQPMEGMRHAAGWRSGRHETGTVSYSATTDKPLRAFDAAQLFLSRELWANDFHFLNPNTERVKELGFSYIPTLAIEEVFIDTFINFIQIARHHLALHLPVLMVAGLVGIQNFRLAVDPNYFAYSKFAGRILKTSIVEELTLKDWSADPFDFLLPLFSKMYDAAGEIRPSTRTIGSRQR